MTTLQVTVGRSSTRLPLRLPATKYDVQTLMEQNMGKNAVSAAVFVAGVISPVNGLQPYLANLDIQAPGVLDRLNQIAERIDGMSETDRQIFDGALNAEPYHDANKVLEIADRLDRYLFLPDIKSKKKLGQFLVSTGIRPMPEEAKPYLDYVAIGEEYSTKYCCAFTQNGFVVHRGAGLAEQMEKSLRNPDPVFRVLLWSERMGDNQMQPYPLELPAIPERLSEAKRAIGIAEFSAVAIVHAETMLPELQERLPLQCDDVELLNDLGRRITGMRKVEGAYQKFLAVLDVEEPGTPDSANELAKSLDDYTLFPDSAEEYGKASLMANYDIDDEVMNVLEGFFDFEAYGKQQIVEDGARETEFGLLRRDGDPFPSEELGQQLM